MVAVFGPNTISDKTQSVADNAETRRVVQEPWVNYAARGEYAAAFESETVPDGMPEEAAQQFLADAEAQLLNFTGRYADAYRAEAPEFFEPGTEERSTEIAWVDPAVLLEYSPVNAFEYLRMAIADRNIVIVNESHQMGQHRAFMVDLLPLLREEGFTHFGMEALSPMSETAWEMNGTATRELGFYFGDPLMASVLSTADQAGFQWFPYEIRSDQRLDCATQNCSREAQIANRELAQARNIYERVFAENPNARVVLYVGFRHLDEAEGLSASGFPNGWMAANLAALTGYDPLTIDQVSGSGIGTARVATSARQIHDMYSFREPSVLLADSGAVLAPPASRWDADVALFLPIAMDGETGRPSWLLERSNHQVVAIDVSEFDERPLVIQAFASPSVDRAIASDQVSVLEGEPTSAVHLSLRAGLYEIRIQTPTGTVSLPDLLID